MALPIGKYVYITAGRLQLEAGLWREAGLSLLEELPRLLEEQKAGVLLGTETPLTFFLKAERAIFSALLFLQLCMWNLMWWMPSMGSI